MLEWRWGQTLWRISLLFPAVVVVLLTLDTGRTALWCLIASAMHEAGHFSALLSCGGLPSVISIGLFGVRMETAERSALSYRQNLWISLAGPLVNLISLLLLAAFGRSSTVPAMVHGTMAFLNLLPIEPLDGGQALLYALSSRLLADKAERIVWMVSLCFLFPLAVAGFYLLIRSRYNFTLLVLCLYLGLLILCKRKGPFRHA